MGKLFLCGGVALVHAACLGAQEPAPATGPATATVFTNVSVLTMDGDAVLDHQAVVVEDGTITWLGPVADLKAPGGAVRIDGGGRYLMPGLADMHVHMDREDVPLFLANGITAVREMNGAPWHVALRDSVAAGLVVAPRMLVASPLLAGEEQPWRHELVVNADSVRPLAHRLAETGYDYLKIYDGLTKPVYAALAEASGYLGLPMIGHIPEDVGLDGILAAGQIEISHAEQLMYATVGFHPDSSSASEIPAIAARIAAAGTWVGPTLASQQMLALARTPAYNERLERPEMRFMSAGIMGWWTSFAAPEGAAPDPARQRRAAGRYGFMRDLTRALFEAGVPLVIGTDTPNPLLVPGYSLHLELAALVDAGIPTLDVLRATTVGAARFAGDENRGMVRAGAVADLVLVRANPLEDLATLETPEGVMVAGHWLDRAELDRMLATR